MNTNMTLRKIIRNMLRERVAVKGESTVREFIKESLLTELEAGEEFDANEKAAQERFQAAEVELRAWDVNDAKKKALVNKAATEKISYDTARKRYKNDPKYDYDVTLAAKKRKTLEDELGKMAAKYSQFNPEFTDYEYTVIAARGDAQLSSVGKGKKGPLKWNSGQYAMHWTPWPKSAAKLSGVGFGKQKKTGDETERGEAMGTGPGEKWLAFIFGGKITGGSVSYDVVMPDGSKCEVKELGGPSSLVRPGTEGLAAYEDARVRLIDVLNQVRDFVGAVDSTGTELSNIVTPIESKIINFTRMFIAEEYEAMVPRGEIPRERMIKFRKLLKALKALKEFHTEIKKKIDPIVTLNKKSIKVSPPTFIDIAQKVEDDVPDAKVLQDLEVWAVVLNSLKDEAFTDHTKFFNEWYRSVNTEQVFRQTDGVFIVNENKGFFWIPKAQLKDTLTFEKVSQGKPKFRFTMF